MAYKLLYEFTGSLYTKTFTVSIFKDTASTITKDDIEILDVNFRIGSEERQLDYPFITNIWDITIQDDNYTNNGYVFDEFSENNLEDYRIDIEEGSTLLFRGKPSEFGQVRKYDPTFNSYTFKFTATDGFGFLKKIKGNPPVFETNYEAFQFFLDSLNYEFDTRYIIDIDNQDNADSFLPDQFYIDYTKDIKTGTQLDISYYELILDYLNFYGLRIYQTEGRWHVIQENYVGGLGLSGGVIVREYDYYQVATSTYTTSSGTIIYDNLSGNRRLGEYTDNDFIGNPSVDVFKSIKYGSVKYKAESSKLGASDISNLDGTTLTPDQSSSESWRGVLDSVNSNIDAINSFRLFIDIDINYDADPISPVTQDKSFNIDVLEIKWVSIDGVSYWLDESQNWVSSQVYWSFQMSTDVNGDKITPLDDTIDVNSDLPVPPSDAKTGYIEATLLCDVTQTAGIAMTNPNDAVTNVITTTIIFILLGSIGDNYTVIGRQAGRDDSFESKYEIQHDILAGKDYNWRSDKDRFKLADTILVSKLARSHKKLTTVKAVLNEYISPKFEAIYGLTGFDNSKDFKINYVTGNLFEEQTQVKFIEYSYDETDIVLQRGIYT